MFTIIIFLFLLLAFDIAAMRWGFNSSDKPESEEWEHRRGWLEESEYHV